MRDMAQAILAARRAPPRGEPDDLVGRRAEVRVALDPVGQVFVDGALWRATSATPDRAVPPGRPVVVETVDGLTLTVRPLPEGEPP